MGILYSLFFYIPASVHLLLSRLILTILLIALEVALVNFMSMLTVVKLVGRIMCLIL